jgi:Ca2+-binding EF-hand superfamily protein
LKVKKKKLIGEQTTETKINDIFKKIDLNENNKISLEEFIDACSSSIFLREILCPDIAE